MIYNIEYLINICNIYNANIYIYIIIIYIYYIYIYIYNVP